MATGKAKAPAVQTDAERDRKARQSRERSGSVREIGPLPKVADPARKRRALKSLRAFCKTYFPRRFRLPFAAAHDTAIAQMEECTDQGGLFACAMPRGMGKTTLAEVAALRAVLGGLRRFVVVVCATAPLAKRRLKQLLRELESNDLLLADFPEACYPIRRLGRVHNRAAGQLLDGRPTRMELTADGIVLPTVPGAKCSGAVVQVVGMEGAIRGLNVSAPDGEPLRPDMAIVDDAQTRESAKSPFLTADREQIVTDDVLGLAGPDVTIAAIMLCTVIYPDDLSDRFLSADKHPEWCGVRTKMLEAMPERMDLWDRYAEARRECFRAGDRTARRATELYRANRAEMDRGAVVSWPERKKAGELSGLQSAMNLYYANRRGFLAEYQNTPEVEAGPAARKELVSAEVAARLAGTDRYAVPREAARLTAFIDGGGGRGRGLWYAVAAWTPAFGGTVIDYGTWPRQGRAVFQADDMRPGLAEEYPKLSAPERLYAGLTDLAAEVLGREYPREGAPGRLRVERCLVDAGWQSQAVYSWCRQTPHYGVVMPSKGFGRTTTSRGVSEWRPRPGEPRPGYHWRITTSETGLGRMVQFDADVWKTFVWERLTAPAGGAGYLGLYGRDPAAHELIAEHLGAECAEPVTVRGTTFDKWSERPSRPDNHLLDCVVGCAVAASVLGLTFDSGAAAGAPEAPPAAPAPSFSEQQRLARRRREQGGRR